MSDANEFVQTPRTLSKRLWPWFLWLGVILGGFVLTVLVLNSTIFSAAGFVSSYLSAVARHDVAEVLSTNGVKQSAGDRLDLLTPAALGDLSDIQLVASRDEGAGVHTVTFEYKIGGNFARSSFLVESAGTEFGLFSAWKFAASPLATMTVTPLHDATFTVNHLTLKSKAGADAPVPYSVIVPGLYVLSHDSTYLFANRRGVEVTQPESGLDESIDIQAKPSFVDAVQQKVNSYLDQCATQTVLFPTGCPFGQSLDNRVEGSPVWTIVDYPKVSIQPGQPSETWIVPTTKGTAHLVATVKSLFDGSVSTFDEDVPFNLSWQMQIEGNQVLIRFADQN
ncbi:MAG: hypothetical protein KF844_00410 [Cryobacterium sp.]|nr:hypothetical protein [Cryobacterium sp.]